MKQGYYWIRYWQRSRYMVVEPGGTVRPVTPKDWNKGLRIEKRHFDKSLWVVGRYDDGWNICGSDEGLWDEEIAEIGPEILPPKGEG